MKIYFVKKYSKESNIKKSWKGYLDKIKIAENNYKECLNDCSCYSKTLENDLKVWKNGISYSDITAAEQHTRMTTYQIINGRIFRSKDCMFEARCNGIEHFLKQIKKKVKNVEFVLNTKDWPSSSKYFGSAVPIFSFSKVREEHHDIMYPAWTFWEGGPAVWPIYPTGLGRWDEQRRLIKNKNKKWPWEKKKCLAFFRGSRTSAERDPAILLSRKRPKLIDAAYTKNQAWKSDEDTLFAEPAKEIPLEDHCPYKYLLNCRGVAASFRLKHLFLCKSIVLHAGDKWEEFFYKALIPWYHYVPVDEKLSDLEDVLDFIKDHDEIAERIANRGYEFIEKHLRMADVSCYWERLLNEYGRLQQFKVEKRRDNFIEIY
ncbi:hypothetical protein SNEBB_004129 [Seison nebaliae]|nr:hypothetical protein SNEBB_004129 [Seison nebaliae]